MNTSPHSKHGNWQKYNNPNPLQRMLLRRFLDNVDRLVVQTNVKSMLDVGCAEGFVLQRFRPQHAEMVCVGADIDGDALRRGLTRDPSLSLQQMSIYELGYESGSFEVVLCLEVLEHLNNPTRALTELKRVSQRYLVLSVPHEPFFRTANVLRGKNLSRFGDDPEHINHWTRREFPRFLRRSGLTLLALESPFPWLLALAEHKHGS